jgi:protein TonB
MAKTATRPLLVFLALSSVAHGALIVVGSDAEPSPGARGTELQIALPLFPVRELALRLTPSAALTGQDPAPAAGPRVLSALAPTAAAATTESVTSSTPVALADAPSPAVDASNAADSRTQHVRRVLWRALGASFRYPLLAQRNGWQGEVRLSLIVDAHGELSEVRIVQSSGYAILDEAAVAALHRLREVPEAVAWLGGAQLLLELPVRYRLVRG